MDLNAISSTFAAVVGLVCNYLDQGGSRKEFDRDKFMEWLAKHNHQEIKKMIQANTDTQTGIAKLMRADHREMAEKLDEISELLANLLTQRSSSGPEVLLLELSEQAVSILAQLVNSRSSFFFRIKLHGISLLQREEGGRVDYDDQRLLSADLDELCQRNLLSRDYGKTGDEIYRITTDGVRYIKALEKQPKR